MIEKMSSLAEFTVTAAPDGVVVAACSLKTAVWSKGDRTSRLEHSQIMAAPCPLEDNVIVTVVAPAMLFLAYQMSTAPATESLA
jgi:hypothetical protein